jgi:hypothetical protein
MRGRLCRIAFAALIGAGALAGCVQMPRHSNTLVFGTNTTLGIKVGTDATNTPGITVGYSRQEAVVMPLVANTDDDGNAQKPCPRPDVLSEATPLLDASCLLMGKQGDGAFDSYSVMASFGAKFGGSTTTTTQGQATGEIAQYFATGLAARELARRAGAAAVATGGAAAANADAQVAGAVELVHDQKDAEALSVKIASLAGDLDAYLLALDGAAKSNKTFQYACWKMSKADCAVAVAARNRLGGLNRAQWAAALAVPAS